MKRMISLLLIIILIFTTNFTSQAEHILNIGMILQL